MAIAHHHEEYQLQSLGPDQEEIEEESHFGESSNGLLMEEMAVQPYPSTKSSYEMLALTISLAGLQSAYCSQFADGTDFLLDIGISPTVIASVWIIPPLCGATLQPLFGMLSDKLKVKVGRREPFVLLGGIGLLCALLTQAWSPEIANSLDGTCEGTRPACRTKIFVSVFAVVVLYASAQAVQVGTRAKMIDECHVNQQLDVNTWASRVISLTSVLYYILSYGLPPLSTVELRMQELALISVIIIVGTISIAGVAGFQAPTPYPASRTLLRKNPLRHKSYIQQLKETITARMIKILAVQFLSSFAWFPYLFYISRYITEKGRGEGSTAERLGPLALFLQSVVHLTTSLALPSLIRHTTKSTNSTTVTSSIPKLEPIQIWRISLALYSASVAGILLTNSTDFMLALAALTGLCWAVTQIIPYTMLTDEFIQGNDGDYRSPSRSGLFLGINNLSLTIPQIIAGLICTSIFSAVSERHTDSLSNGMTMSLAAGSLVSLLATVVSFCI
ncbi:major facilitator superfamily domain-containing protein [Xylaria castorea]|nr:major facilitator superfamily domain-containing protein [Xylaria castorea]